MTANEFEQSAQEVREEGCTLLKGVLPKEIVRACHDAFLPILDATIRNHSDKPNRGPARHFITLPVRPPFADPVIHENDTVLKVVEQLLGDDPTIGSYATDTPLNGSVHQNIHADLPNLFPESKLILPMHVATVNFSFVNVTSDMGPFEIARKTHLLPKDEALQKIESGEITLEPLLLNVGDVLVRHPYCLHRGTPNRTDTPRPVAVITYVRPWYRFIYNRIPKSEFERMSDRGKQLWRFIPQDE